MSRIDVEVAVVGAGPYGLATAAHLKSARVATAVFGEPMSFWQRNMPEGMRLRSPWIASHIAHPDDEYSLDDYAQLRGFSAHEQMPVTEFIRYGHWFQSNVVADVDRRKVNRIERAPGGFRLHLDDGESVSAQRVVIAMGLAHQEFRPSAFSGLPQTLASHTCEHVNFDRFSGRHVAVIGRGQSACETAALLSEAGAEVELISRGDVLWLGSEQQDGMHRNDLAWRLRKLAMTRGAVGPFPLNWLAESPSLVHLLPPVVRADFSKRCLRAKASGWLRTRFATVRINAGRSLRAAHPVKDRIALELDNGSATFDHVILGTGYKIDIAKLGIIAPALINDIATANGSPRLRFGMESTVRGLHFVGATAVHSFGPLMRFVWGAGFAARSLTNTVVNNRALSSRRADPRPVMSLGARATETTSRP
jgi:cation diffusion facilitator CzcD-associated flavoprotein CzcO